MLALTEYSQLKPTENAMINVTPFTMQESSVTAVSLINGAFLGDYEASFQVCGKVWSDGCYDRSQLIACGAKALELDEIISKAMAA